MYIKKAMISVLFISGILFSNLSFGQTAILDTYSMWRIQNTMKSPVVDNDGKIEPRISGVKWLDMDTAFPPEGWYKGDFNDSSWSQGTAKKVPRTPYLSNLFLRGTFTVESPSSAALKLSTGYYGGIVIYINDKELKREHLPSGKITDTTHAKAYPLEAFVKANGDLLVKSGYYITGGKAGKPTPEEEARMAARTRTLTDITIPPAMLKKGTNLIAIEIIRAPYNKVMLEDGKKVGKQRRNIFDWPTCSLISFSLTGTGASSSVARPAGIQVWNKDHLAADTTADWGNPGEKLKPVRITAARNGMFSGKIMVSSDQPLKDLTATPASLKGSGGTIPASGIQIRYGAKWGAEIGLTRYGSPYPRGKGGSLLGMLQKDSPEANVIPVWITVKVPDTIGAGLYTGPVSIQAGDFSKKVTLEVDVADWLVPDPQNFKTWVELTQVPDVSSAEYEVSLWSDRHFEMIAESFRQISPTGTRMVYIPLIAHTNHGNAESMVRWIKKGDKYEYDFSIMDRYLKTALDNLGEPKIICLQIWEVYIRQVSQKRFTDFKLLGAPKVTVKNGDTTENILLPKLTEPESLDLWKPLIDEIRARVKKLGLEDKLAIGMFPDMAPVKETVEFWQKAAPGLPWVAQGHGIWKSIHGTPVLHNASVWGGFRFGDGLKQTNQRSEPITASLSGWKSEALTVVFERNNHLDSFPASRWYWFAATGITSELRGIGRIGADYWKVVKDKRTRGFAHDRFTEGSWGGRGMNLILCNPALAPGPNGPVATNRLIAMIEGVQGCEARIIIETALTDPKLKGKLGKDLADSAQKVLDDRLILMWKSLSNYQIGGTDFFGAGAWRWTAGVPGNNLFLSSDIQKKNKELYTLAGQVARKLGLEKKTRNRSASTGPVKQSENNTGPKTATPATDEEKALAMLKGATQMLKNGLTLKDIKPNLELIIRKYPKTKAGARAKQILEKIK